MYLNNLGCVFYISKLLKTSRPKPHQKPIEFKAYPHDVSLCVVALIKLYLDKTAAVRHGAHSMFFISNAPSHKPVLSRTGFYKRQVFIPKQLKLILSVQHRHQMRQWWSVSYRNCEGSWMDKCEDIWQIL